jgi:hypothetical protein
MDRSSIVAYLASLQRSELAQLLSEALRSKKKVVDYGDTETVDALCLARCYYDLRRDGTASEWSAAIDILAPPANPDDLLGAVDILDQGGFCQHCRIEIACAVKNALCPICGSIVECT